MSYKIIEGRPTDVEKNVQQLLADGWELNGTLMTRIEDGYHLVVQSLTHSDPDILKTPQEIAEEKDEEPDGGLASIISKVLTTPRK